MDLVISIHGTLKAYQIITIKVDSKRSKPKVERENSNNSEYLFENHKTPQLSLDPLPNDLLLQGGRVSSHSSSELLSSEGVSIVRK